MYMRRKPVLKIQLLATCISLIVFVAGATGWHSAFNIVLYHAGYYAVKCTIPVGYIVGYVMASEIYPTSVRTTGTAICFACGRIGAMISPLLFEKLKEVSGSFGDYFYML